MENITAASTGADFDVNLPFGVAKVNFSWYDYSLFSGMLLLSVLIGIWFGFIKKQSTANDYLLGGRTMNAIPIGMSLVASQISGVALLSIPSDVYQFGINYWVSCLSVAVTSVINAYVYLPVFHGLQITSTYEYLKMRFNTKIRLLASFLFGLGVLLHLPLVIYVPALALGQVTDINIHLITPIICAICIFYTTIGGLKAVVWTDMLQFSLTIGAMIVVFYMGIVSAGGFASVFQKAAEGDRLSIDFDINPTLRDSFWVIVLGWSMTNLAHITTSQNCVQKFLALQTLHEARIALALFIVGAVLVKTTCVLTGLIMYSMYAGCDPIASGQITKADQILPYYVMDVTAGTPGLPGLFIAGIFCASLSTLSASMNCVSGTIYEDFISHFMPKSITQETVSRILKGLVTVVGIVSMLLVYVVEHMGNLLPLIISFTGVTSGPLLGLFTLGVLFPRANAKEAMVGTVTSLVAVSALFITVQYYKTMKLITHIPKPSSTADCLFEVMEKNATTLIKDVPEVNFIFRISYYYFTLIGTMIAIVVGNIVSMCTQDDSPPVHRDLLSPIIRPWLRNDKVDYYSVDRALGMVTYESPPSTKNHGKGPQHSIK